MKAAVCVCGVSGRQVVGCRAFLRRQDSHRGEAGVPGKHQRARKGRNGRGK